METKITPLIDFRLPDYPTDSLTLDSQPLSIIDVDIESPQSTTATNTQHEIVNKPTPAIGIATILHAWHPNALSAFLDLDAWFSMTWSLVPNPTRSPSSSPAPTRSTSNATKTMSPSPSRLEVGRIANQITFGTLSPCGSTWSLMLTFDIEASGAHRGSWRPNTRESMQGERDVHDAREIEQLAQSWVAQCVAERVWLAGKQWKHTLHVEYAPMDVWGDGILMSPHWLYEGLELGRCTACRGSGTQAGGAMGLQRCGRCGTAAYCSSACQQRDWNVHKFICVMGLEDRGQALKISEKGGLIRWDVERMFAEEGSGVLSENANLEEGVLRRWRPRGGGSSGRGEGN